MSVHVKCDRCGTQAQVSGVMLFATLPVPADRRAVLDEAILRVEDPEEPASVHQPYRGDRFEAWLKGQRDISASWSAWRELNSLLDQYRLHADTGTPLGEHVCEGQAVGDCGCLERPDTAGGTENPAALLRRAAAYVRERAAVVLPGVGVGAALADWLEQAADALEGQDTPADEPAVRLARALLAGEAAR